MANDDQDGEKAHSRGVARHPPFLARAAIILRRFGEIITFAGQDPHGRRSRAELTDEDLITWDVTGPNPQGEANTLFVCETLAEALRRSGEAWSVPTKGNGEPKDCECFDALGGRINIQVTRASVKEELWKQLATLRSTGKQSHTPAAIADELKLAIEHKRDGLAPAVRNDLVLALDATRVSAFALPRVANEFRSSHGAWCAAAGFKAVWLVGPFPDLVTRLD
jgi:hypothetical protein